MRYIFFGTPRFAAIILEKLIEAEMAPAALVCNPDRPVGRKQVITPPPTKKIIIDQKLENKVRIFQPEDPLPLVPDISSLMPDFFIVAAYAKILPKEILEIPKLGAIGAHPSLLPKYRGSSPIQSAILTGEEETGISLFLIDEQLDHGSIIAWRKVAIDNLFSNSQELENKLAELSAELLIETLPKFAEGGITPLPQDESEATYTKKFTSEDGFVSPEDLGAATSGNSPARAVEIDRKIRALNPEPGVWTPRQVQDKQKRIKLLEAKVEGNKLILKKIQEEGKKPVQA